MIHSVIAVRDDAVGAFQIPFFTRSTAEAVRGFTDAVNNPETPFYKHSKDYTLWLLAHFDDNTGAFNLPDTPELIVHAMNVLQKRT